MHLKKVTPRHMVGYAFHILKEIRLLGRCRIAVIDRYDPVISLLDFDSQKAGREAGVGLCNTEFPVKPIVFQLWHAFGAYKKFGFQSVDTPEGHSADFTSAYRIHRNYSWVMCSGSGARAPFAQAFSCPLNRVVALDRPEYDELVKLRTERESRREDVQRDGCSYRVLMAPTLRINKESAHPFKDLYEARDILEAIAGTDITWSFHPLESGLPAPGNVSKTLLKTDLLVTDYSSIVYEAYLLGIPTLFYIPDLKSYQKSPGLNADPSVLSPQICAYTEDDLIKLIKGLSSGDCQYPFDELERFAGPAFEIEQDRSNGTAASRLVDFLIQNS